MAMIDVDGGEARAARKNWTGTPNTFAAGRFGIGSCWRASGGGNGLTFPAKNQIVLGFGYFWTTGGAGNIVVFYGPNGTPTNAQMTVRSAGDGSIQIYRGSSSNTLLQTTPVVLVNNSWVYIEVKIKIHDTTGVFELRVNENVVYTFAGDTCQQSADTTVNRFELGTVASCFYDDLYVLDDTGAAPYNNYLGDIKIESLFPNNNGATSQLVGSDGNSVNNYLQVDEIPAAVADYNGSATVNQKDTYALTDLVTTAGTILGVKTSALCFKSDAGVGNMKTVERHSGGTERDSASQALSASPGNWIDNGVQIVDPTTAAWTIATVNAMEAGVKVA